MSDTMNFFEGIIHHLGRLAALVFQGALIIDQCITIQGYFDQPYKY
jgi:hypothetical protein